MTEQIKQFKEERRKEEMFGDPMKGNVLPEMLDPNWDADAYKTTKSFPISPIGESFDFGATNMPV